MATISAMLCTNLPIITIWIDYLAMARSHQVSPRGFGNYQDNLSGELSFNTPLEPTEIRYIDTRWGKKEGWKYIRVVEGF